MYIRIEGERSAVVCVEKSASGTSTHTAAILPRIGVAPWGRSAYSARARVGKTKTSDSAVGGVQSHYGGKPP